MLEKKRSQYFFGMLQALEPTDPMELSWWSSGAIEVPRLGCKAINGEATETSIRIFGEHQSWAVPQADIRQDALAAWPDGS